jgi:hypothetical protein
MWVASSSYIMYSFYKKSFLSGEGGETKNTAFSSLNSYQYEEYHHIQETKSCRILKEYIFNKC